MEFGFVSILDSELSRLRRQSGEQQQQRIQRQHRVHGQRHEANPTDLVIDVATTAKVFHLRKGAWLPDGYCQIFRSYVFGPSGFWTMALLRYAAKLDAFLSLDCAPTPSTLAQSKERKGSNFAIWQPWKGVGAEQPVPREAVPEAARDTRAQGPGGGQVGAGEQEELLCHQRSVSRDFIREGQI